MISCFKPRKQPLLLRTALDTGESPFVVSKHVHSKVSLKSNRLGLVS